MNERYRRLLELLAESGGWLTTAVLAERLGVTPRSVRNYVSALKSRPDSAELVESGPQGYRIDRAAYGRWLRAEHADDDGPTSRSAALLRRLIDTERGLDVYALAEELHLSESTVEADLARVRARLAGSGLALRRSGSVATVQGPETARRRTLSTLFREEARGMLELEQIQREFPAEHLTEFKTALLAVLGERGDLVNEFGLNNVLLHVAIAVDRASHHHALLDPGETPGGSGDLSSVLGELVEGHFGARLGTVDLDYLASLIATRVVTARAASDDNDGQRAEQIESVRRIVARAGREYLIELDDEDFLLRLSMHLGNLVSRAQQHSYSRNPLTRSIKSSYPMIYELAVYIAHELQRQEQITVNDDEIAYIAMHVGAQLEQHRQRDDEVSVAVVAPSYHETHLALLAAIEKRLGGELTVVHVATRTDVDWDALPGDLVLSTIEPPRPHERVVAIHPFLGDADVERVRQAVARARRHRRRAGLAQELLRYFEPALFLRNAQATDEAGMIRLLGSRMVDQGVIEAGYVDGAIERERMSSTAFTEGLAVPHAMAMTARRTAIAIAINDTAMPWSGSRVNVVAFIAFSEAERAGFQSFFDQFVEVFSEREAVHRLVRGAVDFDSFVEELVHIMAE